MNATEYMHESLSLANMTKLLYVDFRDLLKEKRLAKVVEERVLQTRFHNLTSRLK